MASQTLLSNLVCFRQTVFEVLAFKENYKTQIFVLNIGPNCPKNIGVSPTLIMMAGNRYIAVIFLLDEDQFEGALKKVEKFNFWHISSETFFF